MHSMEPDRVEARTRQLIDIANLMTRESGLTAANIVALPSVIEIGAKHGDYQLEEFMEQVLHNAPLRKYLASVCQDVTNE